MTAARPATGDRDESLREHLLYVLGGGGAHLSFDQAVAGLGPKLRGRRPEGQLYSAWQLPLRAAWPSQEHRQLHSPWELLEHLRICQQDILEFSRDPEWASPKFPEAYWPDAPAPPDDEAWDRSFEAFRADLAAMKELVRDPARDLHEPFPWGDGQTLLREALLVADHNAYHLGQLVAVRRLLGAWPA